MQEKRFLLPFTHGVDIKALHSILQLARAHQATIVALALIPLSGQQRPGNARLEHILQAKDFLVALSTQGNIHSVTIEEHELYTHTVLESICRNAQQLHCQHILLSYEGEKACFLRTHEAQELRLRTTCSLYILCTLPKKRSLFELEASFR
ncbi:MAG: hypothetical protein NVS4B12_00300 [Ktedonobacteraceae bacterium]